MLGQTKARGHALALGSACLDLARQGAFEAALKPLELERQSRMGK